MNNWKVFVNCDDHEKSRTYRLPETTLIGDLKSTWSQDVGLDTKSQIFTTINGTIAVDTQQVKEFESVQGRRIITLFVEDTININIEIYKGLIDRRSIKAHPTHSPFDLHADIQRVFNISPHREFRLRREDELLLYDQSLSDQGIEENALLLVDLSFEVKIIESWTNAEEIHSLYSNDACAKLLSNEIQEPQRLVSGKKTIHTSQEIIEALRVLGPLRNRKFSLELQTFRNIAVLTDCYFKQEQVWPNFTIAKFQSKQRSSKNSRFMYNGHVMARNQKFRDIGAPSEDSLLYSVAEVQVRNRKGKYQVVRVPQMGTFQDAILALGEENTEKNRKEEKGDFSIRIGNRFLSSDDCIEDFLFTNDVVVKVEQFSLEIKVTLSDRSVRWKTQKRSIRFQDVMAGVAAKSGVRYDRLLKKSLTCAGCGRTITKDGESHQLVPVACCKVQSLHLIEPTPPPSREIGTQCAVRSRRSVTICRKQTKSHATCRQSASTDTSTTAEQTKVDVAIQRPSDLFDELKTLKVKIDALAKEKQQLASELGFFRNQNSDLVKKKEEVLEENQQMAAEILRLRNSLEMASRTATQERERRGKIEDENEALSYSLDATRRLLSDTSDSTITFAGRGREPSPRREPFSQQHPPPPIEPRSVLITDWHHGQSVRRQLTLQDPVPVSALRVAVAREIGVDPNDTQLRRFAGWSGDTDVFLVGDHQGEFADPDLPTTEFGDAQGGLHTADGVEYDWCVLSDEDTFVFVPGRVNIVDARPK